MEKLAELLPLRTIACKNSKYRDILMFLTSIIQDIDVQAIIPSAPIQQR